MANQNTDSGTAAQEIESIFSGLSEAEEALEDRDYTVTLTNKKQTVKKLNISLDKKDTAWKAKLNVKSVTFDYTGMKLADIFKLATRTAVIRFQELARREGFQACLEKYSEKDIERSVQALFEKQLTSGTLTAEGLMRKLAQLQPEQMALFMDALKARMASEGNGE